MYSKCDSEGFEPLRAEPNGFLVHHLNHSVTLSYWPKRICDLRCKHNGYRRKAFPKVNSTVEHSAANKFRSCFCATA